VYYYYYNFIYNYLFIIIIYYYVITSMCAFIKQYYQGRSKRHSSNPKTGFCFSTGIATGWWCSDKVNIRVNILSTWRTEASMCAWHKGMRMTWSYYGSANRTFIDTRKRK